MLRLRPHHLIDIIRNIGQERSIVPHPYGHAQHTITQRILETPDIMVQFAVNADDLCLPCKHLSSEGQCMDILPQLEQKVLKQQYNDALDRRILAYLEMEEETFISVHDFLCLIENKVNDIVSLCTHPGENKEDRHQGLKKGIEKLLSSDIRGIY